MFCCTLNFICLTTWKYAIHSNKVDETIILIWRQQTTCFNSSTMGEKHLGKCGSTMMIDRLHFWQWILEQVGYSLHGYLWIDCLKVSHIPLLVFDELKFLNLILLNSFVPKRSDESYQVWFSHGFLVTHLDKHLFPLECHTNLIKLFAQLLFVGGSSYFSSLEVNPIILSFLSMLHYEIHCLIIWAQPNWILFLWVEVAVYVYWLKISVFIYMNPGPKHAWCK